MIHHADRQTYLERLASLGRIGRWAAQRLTERDLSLGDSNRSFVSRRDVARLAHRNGLTILEQVDRWGEDGRYNCKEYGDVISVIRQGPP